MGTYADAHRAVVNFVAGIKSGLDSFAKVAAILEQAKDAEKFLAEAPAQMEAYKRDEAFIVEAIRKSLERREAIETECATLRSQRISETSAECKQMIEKAKAEIAAQRDVVSADQIKAAAHLAELTAQITKASEELSAKRGELARVQTALEAAKAEGRKIAALV